MIEGAGEADLAMILERQLGRPARGVVDVSVWCPHGAPAVIVTCPYLDTGEPFPTTFYLTCPSAVSSVSREEAGGGVARLRWLAAHDAEVAAVLEGLQAWYGARRRRLAPPGPHCDGGAVLDAGIGGPRDPTSASCLHAYTATVLAAIVSGVELRLAPVKEPGAPASASHTSQSGQGAQVSWVGLLGAAQDLWCQDARCLEGRPRLARRAVIDVGTNSVRLLVADLPLEGSGEHVRVGAPIPVVRHARVTRLGEGLVAGGNLSVDAVARTKAAVAEYVAGARLLGAGRINLVGTSAARGAADGAEVIARLGVEVDISAGVVSGEMEARLALLGATLDVPGDSAVIDVGGGSTELARLDHSGIPRVRSYECGCVRDTERFLRADPPVDHERDALRRYVRGLVAAEASAFMGAETLVAVGGTATTLAALVLGLERYHPNAVHHTMLSREQIEQAIERLASLSPPERAALAVMQPGRADVIVAGAEILLQAMDILGYGLVLVSERDLLDGFLAVTV
ncbi:MAG: DUF501 domain-containing protein [Actinobacteria bacterium]|nr:DUF501 domain-containing protein [Actinomycetota bacterium]